MGGRFLFCLLLGTLCAGSAAPAEHASGTVSRALAELALRTKTADISETAYNEAKRALIDVIGVTLAGYNAPGVDPIVQQMRDWGGKPEATLWVYGGKFPVPDVTFANGTIVHALDFDDIPHITALVVPAAFAVGEATGASGKETLAAVVMGVEVGVRLIYAYGPRAEHGGGGFLPSSVLGGFGAVAAACRLKGCSVEQTVDAFGIFYAHASGNRQALFDRTLTKRMQPAIAARAGVYSSYLAARGVTGPHQVFEGEAGLFKIYGGAKRPPPTVAEVLAPQDFYQIERRIQYKLYAACGVSHPVADAAIGLANEHDLKLSDIVEIEIFGVGVNTGMAGVPWTPQHRDPHVLAQFCAPYAAAAAIKNRRFGPAEIALDRVLSDKEVSDVAERIQLKNPKDFGGEYPGGHTLRIRTTNGKTLVSWRPSRFANTKVLSDKELIRKFKENAEYSGICPPKRADAILEAVKRLDSSEPVSRFIRQNLVFPNNATKRRTK